jgi:hypothetical protein
VRSRFQRRRRRRKRGFGSGSGRFLCVCGRRRTLGLKWERGRNMVTGLGPSLTEYGPTFACVPLSLKQFNRFHFHRKPQM